MKRDDAIHLLQQHQQEIRALGVDHLYLFGSTIRNEAKEGSDVDLFFDYSNPKFSLFDVMAVEEKVSDILQVKADVASRGSLHPVLKKGIEQSAVQVF
ncbi:MAG: nucleotidyltransferase family protein [Rickettsiales bacterium]